MQHMTQAVKHEPVVVLSGDGGASVQVRGGGSCDSADLDCFHPQGYADDNGDGHHITSVWIEDQNGVVVCSHEFVDEATPSFKCDGSIVDDALAAAHQYCLL